jgi:hypothetical protein
MISNIIAVVSKFIIIIIGIFALRILSINPNRQTILKIYSVSRIMETFMIGSMKIVYSATLFCKFLIFI